jgi:predicted FMN-binding regulatory protein PaiB
MSTTRILAALALGVALVTGCSQQEPAEQAVAAAEQALADISERALKYVPDEYGALKAELDAARKLLQEQKYGDALAAARGLPDEARAVGEKAAAAYETLQADLKAQWPGYADTLPGQIAALEARVQELSAAKKLPDGIEARDLRAASDALPYATKAWADALAAFGQGDLEGAVARARAVEMLTTQGLEAVGAAPGG